MTRLLLIGLITSLALTGCVTQKMSARAGVKHGVYYFIYDRHENILKLEADSHFLYRYSAPTEQGSAPYSHERSGRYVVEGADLWLEDKLPDGSYLRAKEPMWIVWWSERCYLVQPWRRTEFVAAAITHRWPKAKGGRPLPADLREPRRTKEGWMYLHEGDWLLPVAGKPPLPDERKPNQAPEPTAAAGRGSS